MFETGIKVIDLLEPYVQGGKIGLFRRGRAWAKTVLIQGDDQTGWPPTTAACRCSPVWARRTREGTDLWLEMAGVRRHREGGAGLRADGRAARCAAAGGSCRPDHGRVLPGRERTRTCCCSWTTSSASSRPARRSRPCWAACPRPWATSPPLADEMGELPRADHLDPGPVHHPRSRRCTFPADDYTDPAPFTHLHPPRRHHRALARYRLARQSTRR